MQSKVGDAHILVEMSALGFANGRRAGANARAANECCLRVHGRTKLQGFFVQQRHWRLRLSELQKGAGVPARRSAPRTTGCVASGEVSRPNAGRSTGRPSPRRDSTSALSV